LAESTHAVSKKGLAGSSQTQANDVGSIAVTSFTDGKSQYGKWHAEMLSSVHWYSHDVERRTGCVDG
jgi:hypothetical protein